MSLVTSFRSEILKTKRGATLYFTVFAALIVPIILLVDVSVDGLSPENRVDAFNAFFKIGFQVTGIVFFPMYVVIVCTLLPQIEYRNNTWKQVFASPQTMASVFTAKFGHVQALILVFLLCFNAGMFGLATAIHFIEPSLNLLQQPLDWAAIGNFNLNAWLSVLAICTIQFWLGLRAKNFLLPIGIGFALWMGNMIMLEFDNPVAKYFPYSFPAFSLIPKYKPELANVQFRAGVYAIFILMLGFIDFERRRVR